MQVGASVSFCTDVVLTARPLVTYIGYILVSNILLVVPQTWARSKKKAIPTAGIGSTICFFILRQKTTENNNDKLNANVSTCSRCVTLRVLGRGRYLIVFDSADRISTVLFKSSTFLEKRSVCSIENQTYSNSEVNNCRY